MNLGVDYAAGDAMILGKYSSGYRTSYGTTNPVDKNDTGLKMKEQEGDTFISSITGDVGSGNTCTDGKDDGKIGIGGVVANIAQGAVRTVPNMIKGAVLDKNGNISPLKIAGTVALGAACLAVPALGLGICAFGLASGAAKTVTNVGNALSAKTDEEAKAAWENVGNGAATVAISYFGAKASYGAMEASAGEASILKGGNILEYAKGNGIVETAKALGHDAAASTSKNLGINPKFLTKSSVKPEATSGSTSSSATTNTPSSTPGLEDVANRAFDESSITNPEITKGAQVKPTNPSEVFEWNDAYLNEGGTSGSTSSSATTSTTPNVAKGSAYETYDYADLIANETAKTGSTSGSASSSGYQTYDYADLMANETVNTASSSGSINSSGYQTYDYADLMANETKNTSLFRVGKFFNNIRAKFKPTEAVKAVKGMGPKATEVAKAMGDKSITLESLISKFGYKTVSDVLAVLAGGSATDSSI